jgi:hypothetical protein
MLRSNNARDFRAIARDFLRPDRDFLRPDRDFLGPDHDFLGLDRGFQSTERSAFQKTRRGVGIVQLTPPGASARFRQYPKVG